jgi:hypothetical protein
MAHAALLLVRIKNELRDLFVGEVLLEQIENLYRLAYKQGYEDRKKEEEDE